MTCKKCLERGKTWEGSDPRCAFPDGKPFERENWNCATVNAIRDLITDMEGAPVYCDDQYYQTIKTGHIEGLPLALWVSWYKRRGRTEAMWLLSEYDPPHLPTEKDCLAIIAAQPVT